MNVSRRSVSAGLAMMTWAMAAVAGAQPAAPDVSGVYSKDGASLAILQGDDETLVYYGAGFPQGQSVGTCECALVLRKKDTPTRWTLQSLDASDTWTLRVEDKRLVLEGQGPECCGAGWPGAGAFNRSGVQPPQTCKVSAERAYFHTSDARTTPRKAFVVAGDTVQAYVPATEPDFVSARFVGPKKTTAGQLKREQLQCQPAGSGAAAAAVDVTPVVGRWLRVQRQGKGYVIPKPCSAETPRFTVEPQGGLTLDYGQEDERFQVKALKPGTAAGAFALELSREEGPSEAVQWTAVDAKKGIVRLQGGTGFFQEGPLFVREEKKGGLSVKAEACPK